MKIGFIGTGQMGRHMARRLLEAGYDLTVHDLVKDRAQHLLEKGAKWTDTPKRMAALCEVVVSSLPGPSEVEAVVYGSNGLMAGWKRGDIYVDMSTNSPTIIRRIAEDAISKGVDILDAPVSGGTHGAEAGTLAIMVGGPADVLEKVRKVFEVIGDKIFHCGEVGHGNISKLVNNMILDACNAITSEGLVLGVKAGMDPRKLWEVLRVSSGRNRYLERIPLTVFKGDFEPGFRLSLAYKDIRLALALAKEYGVSLPVGAAVAKRFSEAENAGLGEKGSQSIILLSEEEAGVKVRSIQ